MAKRQTKPLKAMARKLQDHNRVKITRDLLTKALVWECPRYTRGGGTKTPPHACSSFDGTFTNCPGSAGLCAQVTDVFRTMVRISKGEIDV